ncbi:hypothetical protein HK098_006437 [Nowakowskiella sp. JEL0407]|nr:hypothetical protein HK098_006437 [Nowakowskiella sp. JEL0407]
MEVIDELKSNLKKKFDEGFKKADEALSKAAPLVEMEKKTKINKVILIASTTSGILGLILIIANFGGDLITTSVAFVYPALKSLECLEKLKKEDVHQWYTDRLLPLFRLTSNLLTVRIDFVVDFAQYDGCWSNLQHRT